MGQPGKDAGDVLDGFIRELGMPRSLQDVRVGPEHFDAIAEQAMRTPWVPRNPRKIEGLRSLGVRVTGRIPLVIPANEHNRSYLETKALRSGHLIDVSGRPHLLEQIDRPIVEGMAPDAIEALEWLDAEEVEPSVDGARASAASRA